MQQVRSEVAFVRYINRFVYTASRMSHFYSNVIRSVMNAVGGFFGSLN